VGSFLKGKKIENRCVGIGFHPHGISFALVEHVNGEKRIKSLAFHALSDPELFSEQLKKIVSEAGGKYLPAVFVMHPSNYSVVQIEAPEVAADELKNAVRWRVKDLIDFHIDDAEIDIINLPQSKRAGSPKLMYVIATKTSYIKSVVDAMANAGLELTAIDITELTLRNMTYSSAEENRSTALLYLSEYVSLIEICTNGSLCLSRHINLDLSRVDTENADSRVEMMDVLSLEIQRSLDYYESQFANGSAAELNIISQIAVPLEEFQEVAGSYLTVPIKPLGAFTDMKGSENYDSMTLASCSPAIGAALRNFAWTE
jgi:MSHA biogenesis protein MshI